MTPAKILPFRGVLYNQERVQFSDVVTPPYDVISPEMQEEFYGRSPYNFVRVDLAREGGETRYEAAQRTYQQWLRNHILERDSNPALYFHHQIFTLPGGSEVTRKGFFAVRTIEDYSEGSATRGGIKPHEKTLEGPKADRLKLTRAVQANLSPVFSLYSDFEKKVDHLVSRLKENPPFLDFKTVENERHQLWKETDPLVCKLVAESLADRPIFIADGHHRYETALNYRNECRQKIPSGTGGEPFDYVLMYFSNMDDEGLVILPIHRALRNLRDFQLDDFISMLKKHFRITPLSGQNPALLTQVLSEEGKESHAFVMITKNPQKSYLLSIRRREWLNSPVSAALSQALVVLDVTVVHRLVFEEILRISPKAQSDQTNLVYWKDTVQAVKETREGSCELTFLLNPTRIEDMKTVAMAGEKMPQKSTYFYPKILSGLVVYPLIF